MCVNIVIIIGHDSGSAEWINILTKNSYLSFHFPFPVFEGQIVDMMSEFNVSSRLCEIMLDYGRYALGCNEMLLNLGLC